MFHLWLFSFVDGLILPFELFKIILYFWPLCGFIFSRLKEPKYLVHTEENCKLSKFDLELVGNCRSTNCRAGTTQKQNSMIYLIVVIHRHTQYIKAVFFPFSSFSWNNFPKKEFRRIESSSQKRDGMQMLLCCFYVRVEKEACGNNVTFSPDWSRDKEITDLSDRKRDTIKSLSPRAKRGW